MPAAATRPGYLARMVRHGTRERALGAVFATSQLDGEQLGGMCDVGRPDGMRQFHCAHPRGPIRRGPPGSRGVTMPVNPASHKQGLAFSRRGHKWRSTAGRMGGQLKRPAAGQRARPASDYSSAGTRWHGLATQLLPILFLRPPQLPAARRGSQWSSGPQRHDLGTDRRLRPTRRVERPAAGAASSPRAL